MPSPRVLVLRAPGTNCDQETAFAFRRCGARVEQVHVQRLLEQPRIPRDFQVLCLPGGFSYGDDIAAGRILANQIRHHLYEALSEFRNADKLVLGICNGFQVLVKSGILLPESAVGPTATLTWNDSGRFEDRWVNLGACGEKCVFLHGIETMYLPVAHAEGKFVTRDAETLRSLADAGQLSLRYRSARSIDGEQVSYPENPNGSVGDVAGVCDSTGRVFGLMPHPERFVDPVQHPRWTRGEAGERGEGIRVFENAVEYFG